MTRTIRLRRGTVLCAAIVAAAAALVAPPRISAATPSPSPSAAVSPSPAPLPKGIPSTLGGLPVTKEDIARTLSANHRELYFDNVALYSLRRADKFLQATLEIGHFRPGTDESQAYFRDSLIKAMDASTPIATRVGGDMVYVSTQKGLVIASWFRGDNLLILSIRATYQEPKALIRQALGIAP